MYILYSLRIQCFIKYNFVLLDIRFDFKYLPIEKLIHRSKKIALFNIFGNS